MGLVSHLPELIVLLLVLLVVFGPKRLPEIGGALGKGIKEFRKGTSDLEEKVTGESSSPPAQLPPSTTQIHVSGSQTGEKTAETGKKVS